MTTTSKGVVKLPKGRGEIHYSYPRGGPYIDLSFGWPGRPTEVINVWDYETGAAGDVVHPHNGRTYSPESDGYARAAVLGWVESVSEDGWDSWYEDYMENARW